MVLPHQPVLNTANPLGEARNQTDAFKAIRKQTVDKATLEVSRLEKRLTRLTQLLASLPLEQIQSSANKRWPVTWQNDQRKSLEQTIVSWQDDSSVSRCPFCQQDFTSYSFRRHHCRTCGRVVCGDTMTGCSSDVPLSIAPRMSTPFPIEICCADNCSIKCADGEGSRR